MPAKKKKSKKKSPKKTLKKSLSLRLISLTLSILAVAAIYVYASFPAIYIQNSQVIYTAQSGMPYTDDVGRMQVPLRITAERYGCTVTWNSNTQSATLTKDNTTVVVPIGEYYILVNGEKVSTDTVATQKNGRLYLPIRPVLEAFGATVSWDSQKNAVTISSKATVAEVSGELSVHFIDVGQADAILIDNGTFEVLIDAGNNKDGKTVVDYIADYVDDELDYMIATHAHADHIGGLDTVLNAYQVSNVIDSGQTVTSQTYQEYWQAAQTEPNCEVMFDKDMVIDLGGGATLTIIETGDNYKDTNDNSVVSLLTFGDVTVLLTGDMEEAAESASLQRFSDVTVLKSGHHGSKTSSSQAFLDIVKPEYVVISAGVGNSYNHPHKQALERYFGMNATVYGTCKSGTIVMTTDGKTVKFNNPTPLVLQDAGDYANAA